MDIGQSAWTISGNEHWQLDEALRKHHLLNDLEGTIGYQMRLDYDVGDGGQVGLRREFFAGFG